MYKTMAMEQFQTQIHVPDNKVVFTVIDSMTGEIVQTGTFEQAMDYECSEDSKELLSATVKTEKEDIDSDALDKEQNIISDTDWRDFGLDVVKKETSQEHTPTLQTSTEFEPLILDVFCKDEIEFEQQVNTCIAWEEDIINTYKAVANTMYNLEHRIYKNSNTKDRYCYSTAYMCIWQGLNVRNTLYYNQLILVSTKMFH